MKVRDLKNIIADLTDDDDICVLIWTRDDSNEEEALTLSQWAEVVTQFDEGVPDSYLNEWLLDTIVEVAGEIQDSSTNSHND